MLVKDLVRLLSKLDPDVRVLVSVEGGAVEERLVDRAPIERTYGTERYYLLQTTGSRL